MNTNPVVDALDTMAERGSIVTLSNGSEVSVRVCSGRVLPKILRFVSTVSTDLGLSISDAEGVKEKLLDKVDNIGFILQLISKYTDDIFCIVADLTSLGKVDAVEDLPLDDLAKVCLRVVEVNKNFFTQRVLPVVQAAGGTAL